MPDSNVNTYTTTYDLPEGTVFPPTNPTTDELRCYRCGDRSFDVEPRYSDAMEWAGIDGEDFCAECVHEVEDSYYGDREAYHDERDYDHDDAASEEIEVHDTSEVVAEVDDFPPLYLPDLPDRVPRMISFEQEISKGGERAARALYRAGLTATDYVRGYHSGREDGEVCYVERDSSVDAEIIWSKLDLRDRGVAANFTDGIRIVKDLISDGKVGLDMHCGGHIHVDAEGLEMPNVMSLYVLWNHVEDVMYRIGSANWSAHRTQVAYENYAPAIRKDLRNARQVWNGMNYERGALNLSNLLSARSNCHCGATPSGCWSECTCPLHQQTVEFRVWNTTANIRKINAYSALSVAMVEYARQNTMTVSDFPVHEWTETREAQSKHVKEPLDFVLTQLPLTDYERSNVEYCVERCSLAAVV